MARFILSPRLARCNAALIGLLLLGHHLPAVHAVETSTPVNAQAAADGDDPANEPPADEETDADAKPKPDTDAGKDAAKPGQVDQDDEPILFKAEPELLERVLTEMEIPFEKLDDLVWSLELGDYPALLLSDNVDIQLYAGFAGIHPSLQRINLWNMERRFSRAYLDDDLEPCIEADLDFEGGITAGAVKQFITLFAQAIEQFEAHFR